jgi:phenylalanyl-tRNA synthetase beta chain
LILLILQAKYGSMRISFNWLKQYIEITETAEEVANILTSLGLEVEGMEVVEDVKGGLQGVVIGEIIECWKHPNADRLTLTKVNIGKEQLLQVVCGAPNVAKGQKVFLATIGTTLYPAGGSPLTIKKGNIRSEVSEGMICAEDELGLGTSHDGIVVLPEASSVGMTAAEYLNLSSDVVFEIGLTPNRADAMSHIGVAKDLLAWYRVHKDRNRKLKELEIAELSGTQNHLKMAVSVRDEVLCPRYSGICLSGISIQESPESLKKRIRSMGIQPINNIVDITNYIMYEMGQPLHAFDYDQIAQHEIRVQTLKAGTNFKTLDETDRKLLATDLMICDGEDKPLCLAGVFGGLHSGIHDKTTRIFLESAHFNASSVRRSSMTHNLRTQSAKCFEKGSDPNFCIYALQRAVYLIQQSCNAQIDSQLIDIYPQPVNPYKVDFDIRSAVSLSGLDLKREQIKEVLFALDMELRDLQNDKLEVYVPTNKPDVKRQVDIVEEICRVYGFDNIQLPEKIQISFPKNRQQDYQLRHQISNWLTANGLHEIMSLSLVRSGLCTQSGIWTEQDLVFIHNTSNIHLNAMRPSICLGGLEAIQFNANRQQTDLSFYEMGKEYSREGDRIIEKSKLGIWLYGMQGTAHWLNPKPPPQDFFQLKSYIEGLLGIFKMDLKTQEIPQNSLFQFGLQYVNSKNQMIIRAGKLNSKLTSMYDLKKEVWFAEIELELLFAAIKEQPEPFREFSKFPLIKRDLALVIDQNIPFDTLKKLAFSKSSGMLKDVQLFDIYENAEHLGEGKKSYALSFTFEHMDRQMTSEEMEELMDGLIRVYETEVGAKIRK